jgi:hypothetical protein
MPDETLSRCSTCTHGHDLDPTAESWVVCTPQKKAHPPDYCCTGFRRVTIEELHERQEARLGRPADAEEEPDES